VRSLNRGSRVKWHNLLVYTVVNYWLYRLHPIQQTTVKSHPKEQQNGTQKDQQRTGRFGPRPTCTVQRRSSGRRFISLASHYHGSSRESVPGRSILPHHSLSHGLSIQASKGGVHHANLSSKHQLQRQHLSRHPQVAVVTSTHHFQSVAIHLFLTV